LNSDNVNYFRSLHTNNDPLLIANVWDVTSAKNAEKNGFKAIGTSSAALAKTLGYADGQNIPIEELFFVVKRIAANTNLPFSVDLEGGYSKVPEVTVSYMKQLAALGVVGVNIEDSEVSEHRELRNAEEFAHYLAEVSAGLKAENVDMFINVRTDTFLLDIVNAKEETRRRAKLYKESGAHGLFVPCITKVDDIKYVVSHTELPVNVMCMPVLPEFKQLAAVGVKRISMGNFVFDKIEHELAQTLSQVASKGSFEAVFN